MIGHTAAWNVRTLRRDAFRSLRSFVGSSRCLDAAISRHQLKIALRKTNAQMDATLRLVRRDVVDASGAHADVLPIVATANKRYGLEQNLFARRPAQVFQALACAYRDEQETIHSTVVAEVVKRYVRGTLAAFPLRAHGGVYFVSARRADRLFALKDFLVGRDMGSITHIRVMGNGDEIKLLTEEIRHLISARRRKLRMAIEEADLRAVKNRQRMAKKVRTLRSELEEMKDLFGFAAEEIGRQDARAKRLLRETLRRQTPSLVAA